MSVRYAGFGIQNRDRRGPAGSQRDFFLRAADYDPQFPGEYSLGAGGRSVTSAERRNDVFSHDSLRLAGVP